MKARRIEEILKDISWEAANCPDRKMDRVWELLEEVAKHVDCLEDKVYS